MHDYVMRLTPAVSHKCCNHYEHRRQAPQRASCRCCKVRVSLPRNATHAVNALTMHADTNTGAELPATAGPAKAGGPVALMEDTLKGVGVTDAALPGDVKVSGLHDVECDMLLIGTAPNVVHAGSCAQLGPEECCEQALTSMG